MLIYSAFVNGLVAPVILVPNCSNDSNKKIMGERLNHPVIAALGWLLVGIMIVSGAITSILFLYNMTAELPLL